MTDKEFMQIVAGLRSYFRNFDLKNENFTLWFEALEDLDYRVASQAVKKLAQTEEYPPSIATIRKACKDIISGPVPSLEQSMKDINRMIGLYGRYRYDEGLKWLEKTNSTAFRIIKAIGYNNYANNNTSYMMPTLQKLHKEIVDSNSEVGLLQNKFAKEIGKIQSKGLMMLGDEERW